MLDVYYPALMIVLSLLYFSWIVIFLIPGRKQVMAEYFPISVVVPAYNEEKNIEASIKSILKADYPEKKEIIIVNDGSKDSTANVVKKMMKEHRNIKLITTNRVGKGRAVNAGTKKSRYDFFAILDADTELEKDALLKIFSAFTKSNVGAASSALGVKKSGNILNWYQQLEYALSSSWRYVVDKVDGSCIVPGFCAFRKSAFIGVGGFKGDTSVEDYDICMYLRKNGFKIRMVQDAFAYTKVPETIRGLFKQRTRWGRGTLQVMRRHNDLLLRSGSVGLYTMPTQLYWFAHAILYLPLVIFQISAGYYTYFLSQGNALTIEAIAYFLKWITTYGMFEFIFMTAIGKYPLTLSNIVTIVVFAFSYLFIVFSLLRFNRKITKEILFAIFCFFPYAVGTLSINIYSLIYEIFSKKPGEKWEKEK